LDQGTLKEYENENLPPWRFCFENMPKCLNSCGACDKDVLQILLGNRYDRNAKVKCIAIADMRKEKNQIWYAINGIDDNPDDDDTIEKLRELKKYKEIN